MGQARTSSIECLANLELPVYAYRGDRETILRNREDPTGSLLAQVPPIRPEDLGDPSYLRDHSLRYPYVAGAMAGGIGSTDLVVSMARHGMIGFFGAGGLSLARIEEAIHTVQRALSGRERYGFNLLNNPLDPEREMETVRLYLRHGIPRISASGYMKLSPAVVFYRASGLSVRPDGTIRRRNHIFAKISRTEVAREFMEPAPAAILGPLVSQGHLDSKQADLAARVPVAEDITVEGDSGGHTDRQALVPLLSAISDLRARIVAEQREPIPIRVGAAGGIGTPISVAAAFVAGAAYVLLGSVHQSCCEAGTSERVKEMLSEADLGKFQMAPAGDMFEMGVQVQVLKHRTLFAPRAKKLYELYSKYGSIEEIPERDRAQLEKRFFRRSIDSIWQETAEYLEANEPAIFDLAQRSPKHKMSALFRWYLHMGSRWAVEGTADREVDYQVWCGPAMAAFNQWVRGSFLEDPSERKVVVIAKNLLHGAAALIRARFLSMQGAALPAEALRYRPRRFSGESR